MGVIGTVLSALLSSGTTPSRDTELLDLRLQHQMLQAKWNALVTCINAKGGQEFLDKGKIPTSPALSDDDIARLLQLCHPDKHNGKKMAHDMTAKLLALRKP